MSNKALLEKINAMGISATTHMVSLDDEAVSRIRHELFGAPVEEVEETRVRPTVIRRRKKAVPAPAGPPEEAAPEAPDGKEQPETPAEAAAEEEGSVEAAVEAVSTGVEAEVAPEDMAADTVSADGALPEEETALPSAPEEDQGPLGATAAVTPEPDSPEKAVEAPADAGVEAAEAPPAAKKAKAKKAVKKQKKETPAKIVRLPAAPAAAPVRRKDEAAEGADAAVAETDKVVELEPRREAVAKGKKKKREEQVPDQERDRKFFKKKITFRKKEVVEGADLYGRGRRDRKGRKGAKGKAPASVMKTQITTPKAIKRRIKIDEAIVLSDLAKRMGIKAGDIIMKLMGMGVMTTVNQTIDFETATLVAAEFDYEVEKAAFEEETLLKVAEDDPQALTERSPVVTIMGHVDHGKTSLLDVIRKTRVTDAEAGGITQHIGAYRVATDKGQVVFLDTPGHEAFTAMRLRGAKVTDLVVLVVAADDGVMPQTVEAINHARMAEVPIIVAVNKIDKANADPDRVRRGLAELDLVPEEWGGETVFLNVSAKLNKGIDELLEMILLQAELLELKANPDKLAMGHVVEAKLDSGKGPVATVLIQEGTLRVGDSVVCGIHHGRIRALLDDMGQQLENAGPSTPVEIIGLSGVPDAGDEIIAVADEKDARQVSAHRVQKQRSKELAKTSRLSLEKLYEQMQVGEVKDLNLIIKADVKGSIEALADSLVKLSNDEVKINVIHSGTGTITESDVSLAAVSDAIIIGFNVRPTQKVADFAAEENVDMRFHNIIYNVIKEVKDAIVGLMASTFEERLLGRAEVREVFHVPKVGTIAGCYVTDGKFERSQRVRLVRDGVIGYDGKIASLRRFKDDVKEVQSGYECGIRIEGYNDIKVQDQLECYYLEEIKPELN